MYRIMLADDEGIVIESLTYIIEKEFKGQCEIRSAKTGRSVIELAESFRPDIAFMDIHMPGINGIEAIREIRRDNESLIIIIMSAYDKFDYAKEAINLGVKEYLSKPVDKEKIIEVLSDAMKQVDGARESRNRELMVKEKMETVAPIIENGLIYSLLFQEYFEEDVDNYKKLLDISESRGYMGVFVFGESRDGNHMTNAVGSSIKLHEQYNVVRELIRSYFRCFVGAVTGNKIAVYFPTDDAEQEYNQRVTQIDRARELVRKINDRTGIEARMGFGRITEPMSALDSYHDALRALIQSEGSVAHVDDIPLGGSVEESYPLDIENDIFEATEKGDEKEQQVAAIKFFDWMSDNYGDALSDIQLKTLEFVIRAETIAYHSSNETYRFLSRAGYLPEILEIGNDIDRLRSWFLRRLSDAVKQVSGSGKKRTNTAVEKAKDYIKENYAKDVSLDEVSRMVDISPYYFSKIFKEETGENFIEYLTNIRIEKAKKLLTESDMSMKEICASVGYADPNYFSRTFKKNVGVTPTEYKDGGR